MSELTLTKTRLNEGVWYGLLNTGGEDTVQPLLGVTHQGVEIAGLEMVSASEPGVWDVKLTLPVTAIGDDVQTFAICDLVSGDTLATISILAGEALADDIRAEVDLLRAELDMLKRAFRRHCVETG